MELFDTLDEDTPERDIVLMRLLIRKTGARVVASANIIITSCYLAGSDNLLLNFHPLVSIIDDCNLTLEGESIIPLSMYKTVQFRIIVGDRTKIRPVVLLPDDPWTRANRQSFLERMALCGVPVHELKTNYHSRSDPQQDSDQQ